MHYMCVLSKSFFCSSFFTNSLEYTTDNISTEDVSKIYWSIIDLAGLYQLLDIILIQVDWVFRICVCVYTFMCMRVCVFLTCLLFSWEVCVFLY